MSVTKKNPKVFSSYHMELDVILNIYALPNCPLYYERGSLNNICEVYQYEMTLILEREYQTGYNCITSSRCNT